MARTTRTGSPLLLAGVCALALALLSAAPAGARLGELDPAFGGGDGVALLGIPGSGLGAAVLQPDGKAVVGGHAPDDAGQGELFVARLDVAGALDPGFGAGGVVRWPGVRGGEVFDLALEPDGDILAAGAAGPVETSPAPSLSRISPTGVRTSVPLSGVPAPASLTAVVPLPDGKIAVAGWGRTTAPNDQVLVGRLLESGAPDTSFSGDGWELLPVGSDARAWDLDVDAVGRMTVAGETTSALTGAQAALAARFLAAGGPDRGFSGNGQLVAGYQAPFAGTSRFTGLAPRGGAVLAAGRLAGGGQGVLQRITADGELTAGFGTAGAPAGAAVWPGQGEAVAVTSTGGAVVAGRSGGDLQTAWLTPAGAPDPAAGGIGTHGVGMVASAYPAGAALGAGDRLVVAGTTAAGPQGFVARFAPNAAPGARLSAPATLGTGVPAEITAQGSSDPEGETLRFAFDLDGNGSFEFDGGENPLALRSFQAPGTFTVGVRVSDPRGGTATAQRRIAVAPGPPVPRPLLGKQGVARVVSGKVRYRLPGQEKFRTMTDLTAIPNGTEIDARRGKVLLTVVHDASGRLDGARFYDGRFIFRQGKGAVPLTTLRLTNGTLAKCRKRKPAGARVLAVAAKIPRSGGGRRLWGNGRGRFRTRGRYGAATVRGTKWLTDDRCDGTLVRVKRGVVAVKDLQRPETKPKLVEAGEELFVKQRDA